MSGIKYGGGNIQCVRCDKTVYFVEQVTGPSGIYHKNCLTCKECNKRLDSTNITDKNNEAYCKTCYGRLFGPKGYGFGNTLSTESTVSTTQSSGLLRLSVNQSPTLMDPAIDPERVVSKKSGDVAAKLANIAAETPGCAICKKIVYFAEQTVGPSGIYHKQCFRCCECRKSVDSMNVTDREGSIFCKTCYGKKFGPKGFGYGGAVGQ